MNENEAYHVNLYNQLPITVTMATSTRTFHIFENKILQDAYKTEFESQLKIMKQKNLYTTYENQKNCSENIVDTFLTNQNIISIMVLALTQSGKTGLIVEIINSFYNTTNPVPKENIFIITGLSDCDWKKQTAERVPSCLRERVYHRNNLLGKRGFVSEIKNKKNILIIIDELQIAAKENQTIHRAFEETRLMDKNNLLENDVKIVQLTATPDGGIYDHRQWGIHSETKQLLPGDNYIGCYDLYVQNRCYESKSLFCINKDRTYNKGETLKHSNEYVNKILDLEATQEKKLYHIVRIDNGDKTEVITQNFEMLCPGCNVWMYDQDSTMDINETMLNEPKNTTFIFIKEKLRCSKTIEHKTFLGSVFERKTCLTNDSCAVQGLLGRLTGYNDNGFSICFTELDTIVRYKKLWDSGFDTNIKWNSNSTKFRRNKTRSTGTFQNPNRIAGMENCDDTNTNDDYEFFQKEFTLVDCGSLEAAIQASKDFVLKDLKRDLQILTGIKVPTKKSITPNTDGWIETTISHMGGKKVYSYDIVCRRKKEAWHSNNTTKYIWKGCYKNTNDKNSFVAVVFWRVAKNI